MHQGTLSLEAGRSGCVKNGHHPTEAVCGLWQAMMSFMHEWHNKVQTGPSAGLEICPSVGEESSKQLAE